MLNKQTNKWNKIERKKDGAKSNTAHYVYSKLLNQEIFKLTRNAMDFVCYKYPINTHIAQRWQADKLHTRHAG